MDYQQALDYLYSFIDATPAAAPRPSPEQNLHRTRALLAAIGEPQRALRTVVVAGTKGKGSTSAMLESIGRAAGLRTALWSSPHLHSYRERIQVGRRLISEAELIRMVRRVEPAVAGLAASPLGAPTTFAIGFAIALSYFAEQGVDLAVIEVGLGGRYDSANVLTPLASVITSISYDHMELLGDTLGQIAWDKAGILKPGVPAITTRQDPEALASIARVAAEVGAPLWSPEPAAPPAGAPAPQPLDLAAQYGGPQAPALQGGFQLQNARLAIGAALLLRAAGLPLDDGAIARGLAAVAWPARFEVVDGAPPTVIDGAHNGDSAARLVEALRERFGARPLTIVFGASRGKDLPRMLAALAPAAQRWVLTRSAHPRALSDLPELRAQILAQPGCAAEELLIEERPDTALALGQRLAGPGGLVCVTGSLFVAAEAREALGLAEAVDPPPPTG